MRALITPTAAHDIQQIRSYTRVRFGAQQERRVVRILATLIEQLTEFPLSGRSCGVRTVRTKQVCGTPFVCAYEVHQETEVVRILTCFHTAQQWPDF